MRNDTALWGIWSVWGLWLLNEIYPDISIIKWSALLLTGGGLTLVFWTLLLKGYVIMRLLKRENKTVSKSVPETTSGEIDSDNSAYAAVSLLLPAEGMDAIKPVRTRKDTFISPETHLSGDLEGQGNIVIEGQLEGHVRSSHHVRIESGGIIKGDIYAQHVIVNGYVEGDLHAEAVTLQSEGRIEGAIFTDELVIEKGGIFIGHSEMKKNTEKPTAVATIKPAVTTAIKTSSEAPDTSPVAGLTQPGQRDKA